MTDVAPLVATFNTTDLKVGLRDMQAVERQAVKTDAAVAGIAPAAVVTTKAVGGLGGQSRMLSQQLSQVAQQGMATGQWAQAFAIQAADIGVAFGPLGAALGVAAMVALPLLTSAFGESTAAADALETALDDLDAAASRAQKSADALQKAYAGADSTMRSFLDTVAAADRIAAVKAMSDAVDVLTDGWLLFSTNRGSHEGFMRATAVGLDLTLQQAKDLQAAFDQLGSADGFTDQTDAAKALYTQLFAIYGTFEAMPPQIQEVAAAIAQAGISLDKMTSAAELAGRQTGQALKAGFELGKTALDQLIAAAPGSDFLSTAIDRAGTLAGTIWNAASAMTAVSGIAPLAGPAGAGASWKTPHDQALANDEAAAALARTTDAITNIGSAAGGAAPQIEEAAHSLADMEKTYKDKVQAQNDAQISAINDFGSAINSLTSNDITGAIAGLARLGQSMSGIGGMGGFGAALGVVNPILGIVGALAPIFGGLFGGGSSDDARKSKNKELYDLRTQLYALQGNTIELRERELKQLDPTNRAIQEQIWALEDAQVAAEELAAAERAIADERYGLETQLLAIQGDTAALRARELELLDPSNQALQEEIWALEDAQTAMDDMTAAAKELANSLDPDMFRTLFDYQKAQAQALYGWGTYGTGVSTATPALPAMTSPSATAAAAATDASMALLQGLLDEVEVMHAELAMYEKTTRDTLQKWDSDGMPAVRT